MEKVKKFVKKRTKYFSLWSFLFLSFVFIDFLCVLIGCVSHIVCISLQRQWPWSPIFLTIVTVMTFICLVYFAVDSLIQENPYELIGFILVSLLLRVRMVWSIADQFISFHRGDVTLRIVLIFTMIVPSVLSLICQFLYFVLFLPVKSRFGWKKFEKVGTNPRLNNCFRSYQCFLVSMKVELLLVWTIFPMLMFYVNYTWVISYITFAIWMVVCIFVYLFVIYVVIYFWESSLLMICHMLFCFVEPIYFIYKIVVLWIDPAKIVRDPEGIGSDFTVTEIAVMITIVLCIDIVWRLIVAVLNVIMIFSFNKGLKEMLRGKTQKRKVKSGKKGYTFLVNSKEREKKNVRSPLLSDTKIIRGDEEEEKKEVKVKKEVKEEGEDGEVKGEGENKEGDENKEENSDSENLSEDTESDEN